MLTVNRFDATVGGAQQPTQNTAASSSRLAALAERKRKRAPTDDGPAKPSTSTATPLRVTPASSASTAAPVPTPHQPVGPSIHPSRLASAPILAQSVKKAAAKAGAPREKTKAKQRYLNKKKSKRKAMKKAKGGTKAAGTSSGAAVKAGSAGTTWTDTAEDSSEEESDDEDVSMASPGKPSAAADGQTPTASAPNVAPVAEAQAEASSSDSDSSSSDSDSSSSSSSSSDDESDGGAATSETIQESSEASAAHPQAEESKEDERPSMGLLVRNKPSNKLSAEAQRSLAVQGLPRGMVEAKVVDPATRQTLTARDGSTASSDPHAIAGISLDEALTKRVKEMGVVEWFAVQAAVIPHLLSTSAFVSPFSPPRDLCVSAPTGSGKTLAYSIPIITLLKERIVIRLRALIVLPTRDLVSQVKETLEQLCKGTGLRLGTTTGAQSFAQEQALLMDEASKESKLDILITTPGRLIDHLDETPGFTLQHLRFLVIDEADRLLGQSFQDWAQRLRSSIEGHSDSVLSARAALSTHQLQKLHRPTSNAACDPSEAKPTVQKLLFSATLTREPGKLSELGLRDPVFIDVRDEVRDGEGVTSSAGQFTLPAALQEYMLVMPTSLKPLHLINLLLNPPKSENAEQGMRRTLIFTKSVDSSLRLVRLLNLFLEAHHSGRKDSQQKLRVADYSSDLTPARRRELLASFRSDQLDILVASDLISRGIDLPLVENVISYDVPVDVAKYVHRAGRTARAGRVGKSWSLVESQEARHFKGMIKAGVKRSEGRKMEKIKVDEEQLEGLKGAYEEALQKLVA